MTHVVFHSTQRRRRKGQKGGVLIVQLLTRFKYISIYRQPMLQTQCASVFTRSWYIPNTGTVKEAVTITGGRDGARRSTNQWRAL